MAPSNECGQGGQTGDVLIAKNSPACALPDGTPDGFVLNKQNSAGNYIGPKVGYQVIKHCYIEGSTYDTTLGPSNLYAVISTDPGWSVADNSGLAAQNGYIGLVPAATVGAVRPGQDPLATCQPGYDPYGMPSVTNQQ